MPAHPGPHVGVRPLTAPGHLAEAFAERGRSSWRIRRSRLRSKSFVIGQCAVAAGLAWLIAADLFKHPLPFFAPIAAVVSLGTSYGQRLRRVVEVTVGVALGVARGGNYTEWTAAEAGAKRGAHRVIIEGDPASPNAIYYWDHVNPPVRIGP